MLLGVTFYGKLKSATYIVIKHQRFNKKLNFLARDTSCIKLPKRRLVVKTHKISNSFSPRIRKVILKNIVIHLTFVSVHHESVSF